MDKLPDVNVDLSPVIKQFAAMGGNKQAPVFAPVTITANQINIGEQKAPPPTLADLVPAEQKTGIIEMLDRLPGPRLANLERMMILLALEVFPTQARAAAWLGMSPRALCARKQKLIA